MEESFPDDLFFLSNWDYFTFILVRPIFAVVFTLSALSFVCVGWLLAWKLLLVHVPLVQEILGLREKTIRPKPGGRRRFIQFYNRINDGFALVSAPSVLDDLFSRRLRISWQRLLLVCCLVLLDKVFGPNTNTQEVYEVAARPVVKSATEGVNGIVLAYGVTSSGKTHTMHGDQSSPGIIPLAIKDVSSIIEDVGREFLLRVSYLEIYNEVINDLLDPTGQNLRVREDAQYCIGDDFPSILQTSDMNYILTLLYADAEDYGKPLVRLRRAFILNCLRGHVLLSQALGICCDLLPNRLLDWNFLWFLLFLGARFGVCFLEVTVRSGRTSDLRITIG